MASEVVVRVRDRWLVLAVLCISLLLVSLDNTILNVALPAIVREMHASTSELQWIVDAYAVVFAGLLLVMGSFGDRLGRKWVFLAGLVVFGAGSAWSAFSGSPGRLIAARLVMGVGAAAIMPSTLSILTNVFRDGEARARAIGLWSATTGLGVAVGPVVGGWLLAHYWWGSVFLVNVPLAAIGILAAALVVPNSRNPAAERADPVGALLSIAGIGLLLRGIIEAPTSSWSSAWVLASVAGAAVLLALFVAFERRSDHPMLPMRFFASRRFSAAIGAMGLVIFALMGALFLLTQYLQFSLGYSALQTGLRISPIAAVILVVAPLSMVLERRLGSKPVVFSGMALVVVGFVLLSRLSVQGTYGDALPAFFCLGVGAGLCFAPVTESVMGSLPVDNAGVGSATNSASMQTGGALGVAVLGSLLNSRYQGHLAPLLARRAIPGPVLHLITGSIGGALGVAQGIGGTLGTALAGAARQAFVSGLDLAVTVGAAVVGAAALVVLFVLPNRPPKDPPEASVGAAEERRATSARRSAGPGASVRRR